ncbi:MAG: translesion error-prone DNA polymerase V autoproteolytic subunit [Rickettsiella sp.]|nr:translesion error-prone DNA polymerase V autoproteolytic subunit [Rickettsiella sp.]
MFSSVYQCVVSQDCRIPYVSSAVHAGFPSPADDFLEGHLDLNEYLVSHPSATYYVRVKGESMINAGIHDGDLLIVDRSLEPRENKVVIAVVDGQLTVKRLKKLKNKRFVLVAENPDFPFIEVNEENNVSIWGIVTNVIHPV